MAFCCSGFLPFVLYFSKKVKSQLYFHKRDYIFNLKHHLDHNTYLLDGGIMLNIIFITLVNKF